MKTKFFKTLFVLLISLPLGEGWGGVVLSAQNGVTVSDLSVEAGTVTFNVSWKNTGMPTLWSDTVWVFVDYNVSGKMERLPLASGATLTATSAPGVGEVLEESGNDKGVWVVGNARTNGSFSATVQLLTATADIAGACVYGSNYPPVGEYASADKVTFTGTPPYDLILGQGGSTSTASVNSSTYTLSPGVTVESFTDKTGAPGKLNCMPPAAYTLQASASTFCAGSTAGVLFALSGTQDGVSYQLYKDGGTPVGSVLSGTNGAATFSGTFNVAGSYTVRSVASGRYCGGMATSGTLVASAIPLPSPAVVDASFCYGLPGQLQAVPAGSVTIAWYDASTAGNLLYTGNVLPLTPLYSDAASYFARAVLASDPSCVSVGTPASYTVAHCMLDGYCPGFVAGNVGPVSSSDVAACGVYDSGRIGLVNDQAACGVFYPGQIGATGYPAACVSYDAGWIGRN